METKYLGSESTETNFCDRLWQQLGDRIGQVVYESEEENREKGAIIYEKNGKLLMGSVVTGTKTKIEGLTAQEEFGNPVGSFHTHPLGFFPSEEEHFLSSEKEEKEKETPFSPPDLIGVLLADVDALCVAGDGFILHCLTGIKQARENIKAATVFDILRERIEKNQKIFVEDIKKLGLDECNRDISKIVYKKAREAKEGEKMEGKHLGNPESRNLEGKHLVLLDLDEGQILEGGFVRYEEKALATPCHGYHLGDDKKMLWSKGVIGTLSLPEQEKYCKAGLHLEPAPPKLAARIKALREAGVHFRK